MCQLLKYSMSAVFRLYDVLSIENHVEKVEMMKASEGCICFLSIKAGEKS